MHPLESDVHAAGAVAIKVERHEPIAGRFDPRDDLLPPGHYLREPLGRNLEAGHVPMVPDPKPAKTQPAQEAFRLSDLAELFDGDRITIHETGRQAGDGRLVPRPQTELA